MSYSEIKYALNSTLGTDEFNSLDNILMKEVIDASGLYHNFPGTFDQSGTTSKIIGNFTTGNELINVISGSMWANTGGGSGNLFISELSSPSTYTVLNQNYIYKTSSTSSVDTPFFEIFNVQANKQYFIHLVNSANWNERLKDVKIFYQTVRCLKGSVKSIQTGVSTTTTVNISPVNPSNSIALVYPNSAATYNSMYIPKAEITSPTTLTVSGGTTSTSNINVKWYVIEFYL